MDVMEAIRRDHRLPWTILTAVCHARVPVSNRCSTATFKIVEPAAPALEVYAQFEEIVRRGKDQGLLANDCCPVAEAEAFLQSPVLT
jgi:hypothetical protein